MGDEDVKDATEKLKGMLGIGKSIVSPQTPPNPKPKQKKTPKGGKGGKKNNDTPKRSGKDGKQREDGGSSGKGKKKDKVAKENYAWSAFQTSPDASALPMPAFGSDAPSANTDIANAPRAEDLEAKVIAEAEKAAAKVKEENEGQTTKKERTAQVDTAVSTNEVKTDEPPAEKKSGSTGINLAELAVSPVSKAKDTPQSAEAGMTLPPSQYTSPPPNTFNPQMQYGSPTMPPQPHGGYMHPQPMYIPIQVRVPPVLLPGRRMVVTTPTGYQVQIVIPEGIAPGMIIPAHVPAASMMQNSYGYPPGNPAMYPMHPPPSSHQPPTN